MREKKSLCKATCEIFYNVKKFNVFNTNRVLPYELDRKLRHSRKKWQQKLQGKSVNKYQLLNWSKFLFSLYFYIYIKRLKNYKQFYPKGKSKKNYALFLQESIFFSSFFPRQQQFFISLVISAPLRAKAKYKIGAYCWDFYCL